MLNPLHDLTPEDILHARAKTKGVFEYTYQLPQTSQISVGGKHPTKLSFVSKLLCKFSCKVNRILKISHFPDWCWGSAWREEKMDPGVSKCRRPVPHLPGGCQRVWPGAWGRWPNQQVLIGSRIVIPYTSENDVFRIDESHMLLKMLLLDTFRETPTIIFLNKKDLLRKKLAEGANPTDHFPTLANFRAKNHPSPVSFHGVPATDDELDQRYFVGPEMMSPSMGLLNA